MAFHHPKPSYPFHVLVPKRVVKTLMEFDSTDSAFFFSTDLYSTVQSLVDEFHLASYRHRQRPRIKIFLVAFSSYFGRLRGTRYEVNHLRISYIMNSIIILDFGSQYAQLIARRVGEAHVYCELFPWDAPQGKDSLRQPQGDHSLRQMSLYTKENAPFIQEFILKSGFADHSGICYGMQALLSPTPLGSRLTLPRNASMVTLSTNPNSLILQFSNLSTLQSLSKSGCHMGIN